MTGEVNIMNVKVALANQVLNKMIRDLNMLCVRMRKELTRAS